MTRPRAFPWAYRGRRRRATRLRAISGAADAGRGAGACAAASCTAPGGHECAPLCIPPQLPAATVLAFAREARAAALRIEERRRAAERPI